MDIRGLQNLLAASGRYHGTVDGVYGPMTGAAVMLALTDGPDTQLTPEDYQASATRLNVESACIQAFSKVESSGAGFADGRPVLLFEPHRFSKATDHVFDATHPQVSYRVWDPKKYPGSQQGRYAQLVAAIALNVDAAFSSASYGRFQVLGENYSACGYQNSYEMAVAQAYDEQEQLKAFEGFITQNGIVSFLRVHNWAKAAERYNGTGYALNHYDTKLEQAYQMLSHV